SVITTNITRTARWDIARRGNIYAESYHNRKREKASGYIGSNPSELFIINILNDRLNSKT
ncbi:hypothetical protein, partial [Pantoea phytobeneficialis]